MSTLCGILNPRLNDGNQLLHLHTASLRVFSLKLMVTKNKTVEFSVENTLSINEESAWQGCRPQALLWGNTDQPLVLRPKLPLLIEILCFCHCQGLSSVMGRRLGGCCYCLGSTLLSGVRDIVMTLFFRLRAVGWFVELSPSPNEKTQVFLSPPLGVSQARLGRAWGTLG